MAKSDTRLANLKPAPSLKEMAFKAIKKAIVSYQLKPGILYKEQAIANELGISKTPVREALLELSTKGFLTFFPRKGFEINNLSAKNIRDLFELRILLETAVIRNITPDISADAIQDVEEISAREQQLLNKKNRNAIVRINRELHNYFSSLTANDYLVASIRNIQDMIEWVITTTLETHGHPQKAYEEHCSIIESLKKHDTERTVSKMEAHLRRTEKEILAYMEIRGNKIV